MKKYFLLFNMLVMILALSSCSKDSGETSEIMSEKTYDEVSGKYLSVSSMMSEGLACVKSNRPYKCGFVNKKGIEVIPCIYDDAYLFSQGRAVVVQEKNYHKLFGFIDKEGKEVVPYKYARAYSFTEEKLALVANEVKNNDSWFSSYNYGFIDLYGTEVIPCKYLDGNSFSEGLAAVSIAEEKGYGFIDEKGECKIDFQYDGAESFSEGLAWVMHRVNDEKIYSAINHKGETMFTLPKNIEPLEAFQEGLAEIQDNGQEIEVQYFHKMEKTNPQGFVNNKGEIVIPCIYKCVFSFEDGEAYVIDKDDDSFYINKKGEEIED